MGFLGVGICLRGFFVEIRSMRFDAGLCCVRFELYFIRERGSCVSAEGSGLVSECMPEYVVVTVFLPVHQLIFSVLRFFQRICANR